MNRRRKQERRGEMIKRYTRPEMEELWTESQKKKNWLRVELAVLSAEDELGCIPQGVAREAQKVRVTEDILARADEIERTTDHDLVAFVLAVTEKLPPEVQPYFHAGLTSFDVEDTGLALTLVNSLKLISQRMKRLLEVILERAKEHKRTLMIGRTHGVHAEPITFGFKLLDWADVISRHFKRIKELRREVAVGKISGAVGTYTLEPRIEELACRSLGLRPAKISTQILSRDVLYRYSSTLVGIANSLDRFATEIRNLSRTEIREVAEFKRLGAKGSSAMPGKSRLGNPIKDENVSGLARQMRGYLIPPAECEVVWHERTLENSAPERIYLPDETILIDFMLHRFTETLGKLVVYPKRMEYNMQITGGIIFAQRIMLALIKKGMARHEAYNLLEQLALQTGSETYMTSDGKTFRDLVFAHPEITHHLSVDELAECFDPWQNLKYLDVIFARFGI